MFPQIVDARWSVLADGLSVNGRNPTFSSNSSVPIVAPGNLVALMDTGTSLPDAPHDVADFIYSGIPGSVNGNGT